MSKTILILGGNGYIGSRLINDLGDLYGIESVDTCWFGKNLEQSIVQDYKTLTKEYINKFDVIILLAGHSSVKMCDGPLESVLNNNVINFVTLVDKMNKEQTLLYASSGSVYGNKVADTNEDIALSFTPVNNYDLSKYTLDEHAVRLIQEGHNIIGFRFGTVNGWSPNTRDELMINSMTKRSIEQGEILVNNTHIARPILGIADISRAINAVIQNPISGIYNLTSFYDTVDNISNAVGRLTGAAIVIQPDLTDVYDFTMGTSKFRRAYDFTFTENIDSIVNEIISKTTTFSNRNQYRRYE